MIYNNIVEIKYLPTANMPSDILTKGLSRNQHFKFMIVLDIVHC